MAKKETAATIVNAESIPIEPVNSAPAKSQAEYVLVAGNITLKFGKSLKQAKAIREQLTAQGQTSVLTLTKTIQ